MKNVAAVHRQILILLIVLGVVDVATLSYLLLPSRSDITAQRAALADAQSEARRLTQTVAPLRGLDGKLKKADTDIATFYKSRVVSRYSEVAHELDKLASKNRVTISTITYKQNPTTLPDLQALELQADISGPYPALAKFVNSLERDKIFFIINNVSLAGQNAGEVRLTIRFDTFLRLRAEEI